MSWKHLGTVRVLGDDYRFVLDLEARFGCYYPELHVYRHGPNGSPAGWGPKGFPSWLGMFRPHYDKKRPCHQRQWLGMLAIPIPHIPWGWLYRRTPRKLWPIASRLYRANYWLMRKAVT